MRDRLIMFILPTFIKALFNTFEIDELKQEIDKFIDRLENRITLSETKFDDALLPVIYMVRNILDIPDYTDKKAS